MDEGIRTVPDRMLGCWRRRYIRFKDGHEDTETAVIWLQTLSGMVDIRIPRRTINYSDGSSLQDYTLEQLLELATQDCGTAITTLDESTKPYATASWETDENDAYIQTVVNFPEDGWFDWKEDGLCMMEWAPSGAYEEDWRLQENSRAYVAEFRNTKPEKSKFVYVAGDHAVYVRGRELQVSELRPLKDIAMDARHNRDHVISLVDSEFSYAQRDEATNEFIIEISTLPFREKQNLEINILLTMEPGKEEITNADSGDVWRRISQWSNE